MKKYFTLLAILALGLSACKKVELPEKPEDGLATDPEILAEAPVCYFSLSASIGADSDTKGVTLGENTAISRFEASDSVYVFIEGKGANAGKIAVSHEHEFFTPPYKNNITSLTLSNISGDGKSCELTGALKFYYEKDYVYEEYVPAEGDIVHLAYNMLGTHFPSAAMGYLTTLFGYSDQTGAADGYADPNGYGDPDYYFWGAKHFDFATAEMQITGVTGNAADGYTLTLGQVGSTANTHVSFRKMQSLFRQQLAFTDNNGAPMATAPTITMFSLSTAANEKMVRVYYPFSPYVNYYCEDAISINNPSLSDGSIYFALMFNDENKNEALRMHAYADDGNVYSITKAAPTGGFANGRYYYGSSTMSWLHQVLPASSARTTNGGLYYAPDGNDVTLRGDFPGYYITLAGSSGCHVTLGGNGTGTSFADNNFLDYFFNNASLTLESDYIINCPDYGRAISVPSGKPLKLSTTGGTYTLTLIVNETTYKGVCDSNNGSPIPATVEGASGYVAVLTTDGQNNGDGTYTYVYTVMPGAPVNI